MMPPNSKSMTSCGLEVDDRVQNAFGDQVLHRLWPHAVAVEGDDFVPLLLEPTAYLGGADGRDAEHGQANRAATTGPGRHHRRPRPPWCRPSRGSRPTSARCSSVAPVLEHLRIVRG